ncbi:hypothetical protein AgCh_035636 [Apium graveolens]
MLLAAAVAVAAVVATALDELSIENSGNAIGDIDKSDTHSRTQRYRKVHSLENSELSISQSPLENSELSINQNSLENSELSISQVNNEVSEISTSQHAYRDVEFSTA